MHLAREETQIPKGSQFVSRTRLDIPLVATQMLFIVKDIQVFPTLGWSAYTWKHTQVVRQ